jgi:predicted transcriptional regulator
MAKVVTLRLDDKVYNTFKTIADQENRPLSNFIETAAMRYINEIEFVDEFEMVEINSNTVLKDSMKRGIRDYKKRSGRFI